MLAPKARLVYRRQNDEEVSTEFCGNAVIPFGSRKSPVRLVFTYDEVIMSYHIRTNPPIEISINGEQPESNNQRLPSTGYVGNGSTIGLGEFHEKAGCETARRIGKFTLKLEYLEDPVEPEEF